MSRLRRYLQFDLKSIFLLMLLVCWLSSQYRLASQRQRSVEQLRSLRANVMFQSSVDEFQSDEQDLAYYCMWLTFYTSTKNGDVFPVDAVAIISGAPNRQKAAIFYPISDRTSQEECEEVTRLIITMPGVGHVYILAIEQERFEQSEAESLKDALERASIPYSFVRIPSPVG